jgi:hypothetical protein
MKNIIDLYHENPDKFLELCNKYNLKVTGCNNGFKLQVVYDKDTDEITFHNGENLSTNIGKKIEDIDFKFVSGLKKSIDYLSTKKNIIKNYQYLLCEIYKEKIYLLTVIDKNNKIDKDIVKIAKSLGINGIDNIIFNGKLNKSNISLFLEFIEENTLVGIEEYNNFIKELFKVELKNKYSEMIFNFYDNDKCVQCVFSCVNKDDYKEQNPEVIQSLSNIYKESKNDEDFINLLSDYKTYNKLYNLGTKLNKNEYSICTESLSPEIKSFLKNKGNVVKKLYENYVIINYINEKLKISVSSKNGDTYIYTKEYHPEKIMDALDNLYGRRNHNINLDIHNFIKDGGEYKTTFKYESEEDLIKLCAFIELLFGVTMYNGEEINSEDIGHYILNKDIVKNIGDKYQTEIDEIIQDCDSVWIDVYNKTLR